MEIGQRLKQARLEAGLSQRQLCDGIVTRNMLSLIENGSARPSMDTLRQLAARLGKPMGYFLEEQAVTSPNQALMMQVRTAPPKEALVLLKAYQGPDPLFDPERFFLEVLACLAQAETAIAENRPGYAATLLAQAKEAGTQTPYYTEALERRRLLLCFRAGVADPQSLLPLLPDNTEECMLRARAALAAGDPVRCGHILEGMQTRQPDWYLLRGESLLAQNQYKAAAAQLLLAPQSMAVYEKLELCYRELGDYKQAYFYACKQK